MLCGQGQAWTPELLSECVTFDHGYSAQSPPIKALMEVMCGYGQDEQRSFLRFVTGAPEAPPGWSLRAAAQAHGRVQTALREQPGAARRALRVNPSRRARPGRQGFAVGDDVRELSEAAAVQLRRGAKGAPRVRHHRGRRELRSILRWRGRRRLERWISEQRFETVCALMLLFSTGTFPRANAWPARAPGLYDRFSPAPSSIPLTVAIAPCRTPSFAFRGGVSGSITGAAVVISESGFTGLRVNGVRPASKHANSYSSASQSDRPRRPRRERRDPSVGNTAA